MANPGRVVRFAAAGVAAAVHLAAFALPVFTFDPAQFHRPLVGAEVALYGVCAACDGVYGWCANPLFWPGVVVLACGLPRLAAVLGLSGTLVAATSWQAMRWWFNEGMSTPIAGYGPGFYVWFASFPVLTAGAVVAFVVQWATAPLPAVPVRPPAA